MLLPVITPCLTPSCWSCRCAEAFVSAGRHEQAVRLLVKARQQERALELLLAHEVPLTDELAEALTPDKTPDNADSRAGVLLSIARVRKPSVPHTLSSWKVIRQC